MSARDVVALESQVDRAVEKMRRAGGAPGTGDRPAQGFTWTAEAVRVRDEEVVPLRAALRAQAGREGGA